MEKTLILLAGPPATGKTDLADRIKARHTSESFLSVSLDDVKEEYWDTYGFNNAEEKAQVDANALQEWFRRLDVAMADGPQIMCDYPLLPNSTTGSPSWQTSTATVCSRFVLSPIPL